MNDLQTRTAVAPTRREFWLSALGYVFLVAILFHRTFFGEVLSGGANLFDFAPFWPNENPAIAAARSDVHGDTWRQFATWGLYQRQAFKEGRFPLWNPHIYLGMPIHSNSQSAMLQPAHVLNFFFDPFVVRTVTSFVELFLAAIVMNCFARRLGIGSHGAFLSGAAWILCSYNIRWLLWDRFTTVSLPLVLLTLESYLRVGGMRRLSLMAFATLFMQLCGHPETQFHIGTIAGIFALMRVGTLPITTRMRLTRLLGSLAAILLGTAAAAAALLPFLSEMIHSPDWSEHLRVVKKEFTPSSLILFLLPDFYGRPRASFAYYGPMNYIEATFYFGAIPLNLALVVVVVTARDFFSTKRKSSASQRDENDTDHDSVIDQPSGMSSAWVWFWFLQGMIWLAIAVGFPLAETIVAKIPLFRQSNNIRLFFAMQFCGALLAGAGLDAVVARKTWARGTMLTLSGAFACIAAVLIVPKYGGEWLKLPLELDLRSLWHHPAVRNFGALVLAIAMTFTALWIVLRKMPSTRSVAMILLVLSAAELLWTACDFNPSCAPNIANPAAPPLLKEFVVRAGAGRITAIHEVLIPNLAMRFGFRDVRGFDYPRPERIIELTRALDLDTETISIGQDKFFPKLNPKLAAFFDHTAVRFLYSDEHAIALRPKIEVDGRVPGPENDWKLVGTREHSDVIYENPRAHPRVWLAKRAEPTDRGTALQHMLNAAVDLRIHSVYEKPAADISSVHETASGTVRIESDQPEEVRLKVESATGGLVVLADRFANGWTVTIDGKSAPPIEANYLLRGVMVPPGEHTILWSYSCPGFRTGIVISAFSLVVMIILVAVPGMFRRAT